jgi:hypothetical protein
MKTYLILIFLLSPALSVVCMFGFPYFPNEKIAFILVLHNLLGRKLIFRPDLLIAGFSVSLVLTVIVVIRSYQGSEVNITDINMIYLFFALVFYIAYFELNFYKIASALPGLVFLQLMISIFQQVAMQFDMPSLAFIFNNYPPQFGYQYPITNLGFYRTAGLFNESSQYATFLVFFIIIYQEGMIKRSKFTGFLLLASIVEIVLNQSITAFLIIFSYFACKSLGGSNGKFLKIIFLLTFAYVFGLIFPDVFEKINYTLRSDNESYSRLLFAYQRIELVINENLFIGNGLYWDTPSWDVISIYFSGYGLIGLAAILCFMFFIFRRANIALIIMYILFSLTNGNLLVTLNIFLISFLYAVKYINI